MAVTVTDTPASLKLWAQKTSVPYEWIRYGTLSGEFTNDDQAKLPAPMRLRLTGAAFLLIPDQVEGI